jgi:hypothetical protein
MRSPYKLVCLTVRDSNFFYSGDSSMNTKLVIGAAIAALALSACGSKEEAAPAAAPAAPAAEAAPAAPAAEPAKK